MSARGPLGEIRVVECAAGLPASYAGFLLAGLGAEVVRIEPAATSPGASGDHVLRRGKRSAVLEDGDARATGCRHALCESADVLLADETAPETEPAAGRIDCRVSPWGAGGHPQGLPADEALVAALTGAQAMQWSWAGSPVWLATPLIGYMTGALAALGVTAALLARARGTPGQRIEVSAVGGALALGSGSPGGAVRQATPCHPRFATALPCWSERRLDRAHPLPPFRSRIRIRPVTSTLVSA